MKKIIGASLLFTCLNSQAALISYNYGGEIDRTFYGDCQGYASSGSCNAWDNTHDVSSDYFQNTMMNLGDVFSGRFTYDTETPLSDISDDGAQAVHLRGLTQSDFSVGSVSMPGYGIPAAVRGSFSVVNDRNGRDSFFITQSYSSIDWFVSIDISFQDRTGQVYDSFDVPTALDLNDFHVGLFHAAFLRRSDGDQFHLYGNVANLNAVGVSEPVGIPMLLLSGLMLLGMKRRTQRKSNQSICC